MSIFKDVYEFTSESGSVGKRGALSGDQVKFITRMIMSEVDELVCTRFPGEVDEVLAECWETRDKHVPERIVSIEKESDDEEYCAIRGDRLVKTSVAQEQADAFVDIIYYIANAAAKNRINLEPIFREVHRANMDKRFPDGKFHKREDGKVIKPDGWRERDLTQAMKESQF